MDKQEKLDKFFTETHQFKNGVDLLRTLAISCGLIETYKWSFPTYTFNDKNIIAIGKFKAHFSIWFFNGVFLTDPKKVLENAQEGKTRAMRHWKFSTAEDIHQKLVITYIKEAIENQKKGLRLKAVKKPKTKIKIPALLTLEFEKNLKLKTAFNQLTFSKQKEYTEYIINAKQEKTKLARVQKILPLILVSKGLNDKYKN